MPLLFHSVWHLLLPPGSEKATEPVHPHPLASKEKASLFFTLGVLQRGPADRSHLHMAHHDPTAGVTFSLQLREAGLTARVSGVMKQLWGRQLPAATFIPLKNEQSDARERQVEGTRGVKILCLLLKKIFSTPKILKRCKSKGNKQLAIFFLKKTKQFYSCAFYFCPLLVLFLGNLKKKNKRNKHTH